MTLRASVLEEGLRFFCVIGVGFRGFRFNFYIHFHSKGCNLGSCLRFICTHLFLPLLPSRSLNIGCNRDEIRRDRPFLFCVNGFTDHRLYRHAIDETDPVSRNTWFCENGA